MMSHGFHKTHESHEIHGLMRLSNTCTLCRPVTGPSRRNVTLKRVSVVDRLVQLSLNWQDVQNTRSCLIRI